MVAQGFLDQIEQLEAVVASQAQALRRIRRNAATMVRGRGAGAPAAAVPARSRQPPHPPGRVHACA